MRDTRERILEAAEAVLVRKGADGARMHEIASAAGVNQALIHYYFGTKEDLRHLVLRRVVRRSVVPVARVWSVRDPVQVNIPRVVRACTEELRGRPGVPGFLLSALHRQPSLAGALLEAVGEDLEGVAPPGRQLVRRLAAELRRDLPSADVPTLSAVQLLTNLVALCLFPFVARPALQVGLGMGDDGFDRFLDRHVDQVAAFLLRGLDPGRSGDPYQGMWPMKR